MLILAGLCVLASLCALVLPRGRMPEASEAADRGSLPEETSAVEPLGEEQPMRFCGVTGPPLRSCPGSTAGSGAEHAGD